MIYKFADGFFPRQREIIPDVNEGTVMFVTIKNQIVQHLRTNALYLNQAGNSKFVIVVDLLMFTYMFTNFKSDHIQELKWNPIKDLQDT